MKRITGMYVKPVRGDNPQLDTKIVLKRLKRQLHKRIKVKIEETGFSARAKRAFSKAVQIRLKPNSLQVVTNHPGFLPMIKGQKSRQMTWLVKAKRPIPIVTDEGKLIFRSATPKSMADGKWVHPGRQPTTFIDRAKKEARRFVLDNISKEMVRQLRQALGGKKK